MKYKLTDEQKNLCGKILHRIQALKDFGDVEAGDLGGFVECCGNLSQDGKAWVRPNAMVCGKY